MLFVDHIYLYWISYHIAFHITMNLSRYFVVLIFFFSISNEMQRKHKQISDIIVSFCIFFWIEMQNKSSKEIGNWIYCCVIQIHIFIHLIMAICWHQLHSAHIFNNMFWRLKSKFHCRHKFADDIRFGTLNRTLQVMYQYLSSDKNHHNFDEVTSKYLWTTCVKAKTKKMMTMVLMMNDANWKRWINR